MAYTIDGSTGVDLTATPADSEAGTPGFALGKCVSTNDGGVYMYVHANGAITQYDFVGIDENFEAASLTTAMADDGWMIGAAQVAFADNDYGWVATKGSNINGAVLASCAADVALYTSATAGSLDDATTTTKIDGVVVVTALGTPAGGTEVIMTHPKSGGF